MTSSSYPNSATLAAFRRTFHVEAESCITSCPTRYVFGAWPHEREQGIGYSNRLHSVHARSDAGAHGLYRREANRMRSEAVLTLLLLHHDGWHNENGNPKCPTCIEDAAMA